MRAFNRFGLPPSPKLDAPFPAWSQKYIQIVELAIFTAWQCLVADTAAKQILETGTEVDISIELLDVLAGLLNEKSIVGFNGYVFEPPIRGQELEDVTGTELEKRPDISIRLRTSVPCTQHNSLFFECKRLSPTRRIADYVNEGLIKFCDQRYAWGMNHAGMLAYVQDINPGPQANIELENYWITHPINFTMPICDPVVENNGSVFITKTKHERYLPLPNGSAPTEITIRHLWLSI